jgi:RNA polymerase sigma-70 factor (ECF subfamily)
MLEKGMDTTDVTQAVERARSGDGEGLAELYQTFGRRVLGLCRHLLGSPGPAEVARSEIFARLPSAIGRYDPALPFDRWLLSVTSHHCLDVLRRRRLESRLFVSEPDEPETLAAGDPAPSPLAAVLTEEGRERVRAALGSLPDRYRIVLALRYYGDLGYDDIATQLGLTRNHVATLIFRGKQALRRLLADLHERT